MFHVFLPQSVVIPPSQGIYTNFGQISMGSSAILIYSCVETVRYILFLWLLYIGAVIFAGFHRHSKKARACKNVNVMVWMPLRLKVQTVVGPRLRKSAIINNCSNYNIRPRLLIINLTISSVNQPCSNQFPSRHLGPIVVPFCRHKGQGDSG